MGRKPRKKKRKQSAAEQGRYITLPVKPAILTAEAERAIGEQAEESDITSTEPAAKREDPSGEQGTTGLEQAAASEAEKQAEESVSAEPAAESENLSEERGAAAPEEKILPEAESAAGETVSEEPKAERIAEETVSEEPKAERIAEETVSEEPKAERSANEFVSETPEEISATTSPEAAGEERKAEEAEEKTGEVLPEEAENASEKSGKAETPLYGTEQNESVTAETETEAEATGTETEAAAENALAEAEATGTETEAATAETEKEDTAVAAATDTASPGAEKAAGKPLKAGIRKTDILGAVLLLLSALIVFQCIFVLRNKVAVGEKYSKDKWYESYQRQETKLPELASYTEETAGSSSLADSFRYGNSYALYAVGAPIAEDERYYYFADPTDAYALYRADRRDPSDRIKLTDEAADQLSLKDGRLYYSTEDGIHSISTDGKEAKKLTDISVFSLQMVNDWLYYIRSTDGKLCKQNIADRREIALTNEDCNAFCVSGNSIYYISVDPAREKKENTVICRMNVDGGSRMHLTEYGNYNGLCYSDGMLYYSSLDEGYGMLDASADVTLSLTELSGSIVHLRGFYSVPVVQDNKVWYIDRSADRGIVCYDPETEERTFYDIHGVSEFWLLQDMLVCRVLQNGTDPEIYANRISDGAGLPLFGGGEK